MNAHAVEYKSQPAAGSRGRSRSRAITIVTGSAVVVRREQRDRSGRLLAEAGTRGRAVEQLRADCWLVVYEPTMQAWPTALEDLQPARDRSGKGLRLHPVLAVLRMLIRLLRTTGCSEAGRDGVDAEVQAVIEYMTGRGPMPEVLEHALEVVVVDCPCGESGVCHRCDGQSRRCRACGGSGICPLCPRLAEAHGKLADCLGFSGSGASGSPPRPRRCRGSLVARAA